MLAGRPRKPHYSTCQCYTIPLGAAQCSVMQTESLVWEVLLNLPTESLMRFKCVSKLWYSIIRNPKFAIAHSSIGGGFRGLLIYGRNLRTPYVRRLFYLKLNDCPKSVRLHLSIECQKKTIVVMTRAVKGLMGWHAYGINDFTLCNIATYESVKLPPSPSTDPSNEGYFYDLGFDPVKQVYKVLNARLCYDEKYNIVDHQNNVFTLGVNSDLKWRNIAPAPSSDLYLEYQHCLCINGTIYWLPKYNWNRQHLTAFHLNSETFETIEIPECTGREADLVDICGTPALVVIDRDAEYFELLDVWTMNNHCRGGQLEAWTRKRVWLPTSMNIPVRQFYAGTLPTGEMLLAEDELDDFRFTIYTYDHLKNEFNSLTVEGYGSQESDGDSQESRMDDHDTCLYDIRVCYYEENIISLHSLISNQEQDRTTK